MINCPRCNKETIWQSDFDLEEVYPEIKDKEGIVTYYFCETCQKLIEAIYTITNNSLMMHKPDIIILDED